MARKVINESLEELLYTCKTTALEMTKDLDSATKQIKTGRKI